jgi:hypothetical protein
MLRFPRSRRLPTRPETALSVGLFYVGVGDQFDDDRRLVRETAIAAQAPARGDRTRSEKACPTAQAPYALASTDEYPRTMVESDGFFHLPRTGVDVAGFRKGDDR